MEEFSYIVLDLEWNQPMPGQETITQPFRFASEIIEIEPAIYNGCSGRVQSGGFGK